MKIYELREEQQRLLDEIYWIEEDDTEADIIKRQLEQIEGSVERKLAYLTSVLAEAIAVSRVTSEARKEAQARLEFKEKRAANAEKKLREFILQTMQDFQILKVEGDILNVSQYNRDTIIQLPGYTIDDVPVVFLNVSTTLNKNKINEFLKSGENIPGFELIQKPCLRIS